MTRRTFFSMFTAAFVSAVAAVKVKPHFKMLRIGGFKSKCDPLGGGSDWPVFGRGDMCFYMMRRFPRKYYRMDHTFELPITPASTP